LDDPSFWQDQSFANYSDDLLSYESPDMNENHEENMRYYEDPLLADAQNYYSIEEPYSDYGDSLYQVEYQDSPQNDHSYLSYDDMELIVQQTNAYAQENDGITYSNKESVKNDEDPMNIVISAWQ